MRNNPDIAPAILQLHHRLDRGQLELISGLEGPLLGIAGPGTGKTLAIVLRAVNLLLLGIVEPPGLLLCTYSRAAAQELHHRFRTAAVAAGYPGDHSGVRVTTLHGLCGRLLRSHLRPDGLGPGFRLLNEREQRALLDERFDDIFRPDRERLARRGWRRRGAVVRNAAKYFDRICDELIDPWDLIHSGSRFKSALGRSYWRYEGLLLELGLADFAHLQRWTVELLEQDERIADEVSGAVRHLMCDEYQDTSHVQERLLALLAEQHGNLCVVGDDDQSLYRFRGASVQNMLTFPDRYPDCRVAELDVNHRSHPTIVGAFSDWMRSADWTDHDRGGQSFRYDKTIMPASMEADDYPAVIRIDGDGPVDEVDQLVSLLWFLRRNRVISDYSQAALLLHSVREEVVGRYLDGLEEGGVPAGIPRARARTERRRRRPEVTVTTIHRSKGLEWDVVVVGSLDFHNREVDPVGRALLPHARQRTREPTNRIAAFDHMRQHYVAFSRARRLLALTASCRPHARFDVIWDRAEDWAGMRWARLDALARQRFAPDGGEHSGKPNAPEPSPPRQLSELRSRRVVVHMGRNRMNPAPGERAP